MYWQDHYKNPAQAVAVLKAAAAGKIHLTPQMAHIAHVAARAGLSGISEDPANLGTVPFRLTPDSDFLGSTSWGWRHDGIRGFGYDHDGTHGLSYDNDRLKGLPELDFAPMGMLDFARMGGLKSDIKSALKSSNAAKIQSAINREQAKIAKSPDSKKVAKRIAYVQSLQAHAASLSAPTTPVLPGAPEQPIPQLTAPSTSPTDPMSFSQGSGGGGGGGFSPSAPAAPVPGDVAASDDGAISTPVMVGIGAAALLALYFVMKKR